jgi:hypothetical protein
MSHLKTRIILCLDYLRTVVDNLEDNMDYKKNNDLIFSEFLLYLLSGIDVMIILSAGAFFSIPLSLYIRHESFSPVVAHWIGVITLFLLLIRVVLNTASLQNGKFVDFVYHGQKESFLIFLDFIKAAFYYIRFLAAAVFVFFLLFKLNNITNAFLIAILCFAFYQHLETTIHFSRLILLTKEDTPA